MPAPVSVTRELDVRVAPLERGPPRGRPRGVNLIAFESRFQTTCCSRSRIARRSGRRPDRGSSGARCPSRRRRAASTRPRRVTTARDRPAATSSRSLPEIARDTSSRSSMSCVWPARCARSSRAPSLLILADLRRSTSMPRPAEMAVSGVRSSCETVMRNSSFMRLARLLAPQQIGALLEIRRAARSCRRRPRSAIATVRARIRRRTGRSRIVTLRSGPSTVSGRRSRMANSPPAEDDDGMSDHGGCRSRTVDQLPQRRAAGALPRRSAARRRRASIAAHSRRSRAAVAVDAFGRSRCRTPARRPGRSGRAADALDRGRVMVAAVRGGPVAPRYAGMPVSTPWKSGERLADRMPLGRSRSSRIVRSCGPLRFLTTEIACRTAPVGLEVAQQDDRVGEVARVDRASASAPTRPCWATTEIVDTPAAEVGEQLVELRDEEPLLGHGVEVAVEAVDDDHRRVRRCSTARRIAVGELAGRELGGVDLREHDAAARDVAVDVDAEAGGAARGRSRAARRRRTWRRARRARRRRPRSGWRASTCRAGRADEQRRRAALEPAAEQGVELARSRSRRGCALSAPRDARRRPAAGRRRARRSRSRSRGSRPGSATPRILTTRSRRRSAPYSGASCSRLMTPWARLWSWRSPSCGRAVVEQQHGAVAGR